MNLEEKIEKKNLGSCKSAKDYRKFDRRNTVIRGCKMKKYKSTTYQNEKRSYLKKWIPC